MTRKITMFLMMAAAFAAASCSAASQMNEQSTYQNSVESPVLDTEATYTTGKVAFTVLGDYVENATLKSYALSQVGVYRGYYAAGSNVGYTATNGKVTSTLPSGSQYVTFFKMTSSHSTLFADTNLTVTANTTISRTIHICPTQVQIIAHYAVPYGKALYVTGDSGWLGSWSVATKLTYRNVGGDSQWYIQKNLPIGAQYKIVLANWVDGATISTAGVAWQKQNNFTIASPSGSYESVNNAYPTF